MRRFSIPRPRLGLLAAAVGAALASGAARPATVDWTGGTSFWDVVTNWSSNPALPGAADDVVVDVAGAVTVTHRSGTNGISSLAVRADDVLAVTGGSLTVANAFDVATATLGGGTLALNGSSTIAAWTHGAGTLGGSGAVTVGGGASWLGGTQTGTGTTRYDGALTIGGAATKTISGGRTLDLYGTTTWSGNTGNNNNALAFGGGTVNNRGTFDDRNGFASFMDHGSGTNAFNNIGTYNKIGSSVTTIEVVWNNTGTTNIQAGSMLFAGGSSIGGTWNLAEGTTLEFRNGTHVLNNPTIGGAGTFAVTTDNVGADASVTLNGGTLTSKFLFSGSTIGGTDRTFGGASTWTGGSFSGTATTTFTGPLAISGPNTKVIVGGGTVNLEGTTTWSGNTGNNNNAIRFWNGATINNRGTFDDANTFASFIEHNVGGPHNFNNVGTYNKLSDAITTVDGGVAFNNTGTVNVKAGTFRPSGGTSSGVFDIAAGAVLDFRNGNNTLDGATTRGAGTLAITSDLVGADAVVTIDGGSHTTPFLLSGSTLAGGDNLFSGPVTWTGGTISGAAATTFTNDVTISGAATKVLVGGRTLNLEAHTTWSGNTANNNNAIRFWNGATLVNRGTFDDANTFASFIEHNVGGPHLFDNRGTYNKLANTVTTVDLGVGFANSGTLNIGAGTMRFASGTQGAAGTVNVAAGATYQHDAASAIGTLKTAGNLVLGSQPLTIHVDYDNANFGSGNAFDRRANVSVSGTGNRLVAAGDANQVLTGVVSGTTAAPMLVIGNVHVGANDFVYAIANGGGSGPALRGAIQTAANGGSITDARLSGDGVTAANWGPLAPGASTARTVTVTVDTAGVYAPIGAQTVAIVNNFDNTRAQVLTIGSQAGAAAYDLAVASVGPDPVTIAAQRVGGSATAALTVANLAPAGAYSERLAASFASLAGGATSNGASAVVAAGATDATSLRVGVDTAQAGRIAGSATIALASDGTGSSGLGTTPLASKAIAVVGDVYRLANPVLQPAAIDLAARVGDAAPSMALTLTNASPDAYTERLDAAFAGVDPGFGGHGSVAGLGAGATSGGLSVSLATAAAGSYTGSARIGFVSSGAGTTGAADAALAGQQVALTGRVYTPAVARVDTPRVDFGIVHVGDAVAARHVGVTNAAAIAAPNDVLVGSLGGAGGPFAAGGTLAGVAAQAGDASSLAVTLDTSRAGVYADSAAATFASRNGELADRALGETTVDLAAQVNNFAELALAKTGGDGALSHGTVWTLDFGTIALGAADPTAALVVANIALGPADVLNGSFVLGAGAGFSITGASPFAGIAAGGTGGSLDLVLDSATAGSFSRTITISAHGSNAGGYVGPAFDTTLVLQGIVAAPVPEPGTWLLWLGGLAAAGAARRRRRNGEG